MWLLVTEETKVNNITLIRFEGYSSTLFLILKCNRISKALSDQFSLIQVPLLFNGIMLSSPRIMSKSVILLNLSLNRYNAVPRLVVV